MDDVAIRLPLRLIPRKIGAVFLFCFFLFFFGFSVVWTTIAMTAALTGEMVDEPFPGFRFAFPAFGLPFLAIGFCGLAVAVMKLLPGGRFYHVDISAQGIAVRRAWKIEQFAWPEVSPFGISVRTKSTKGGKVTTHWVVALRASDAGSLADEAERYKRSVLKIDAGEYGSSKAADAAEALVVWLNGIRTEAIERRGRVGDTVRVPPDFNAVALASGTGITGAVAAAAKRSSVIER